MTERYYSFKTEFNNEKFSIACIFPEPYNIAICNLGHQVICNVINSNTLFYADRFYADSANRSHIQKWPINRFDHIFVSLSFEANVINFVKLCKLWGIPLFSSQREQSNKLILGGGLYPTYNPEPFADFFDAIIIGEGEDCTLEILEVLLHGGSKRKLLNRLGDIRGVYVPNRYNPIFLNEANDFSRPHQVLQTSNVDIEKQTTHTFISSDNSHYGAHSFSIEVRRGCDQNCRFYVVGNCYKKPRNISHSRFEEMMDLASWNGTNFVKLFYEGLPAAIVEKYFDLAKRKGVLLRVGSQRLETTSYSTIEAIRSFGQRKLTFAPETSVRLRRLLGKTSLSNEGLFSKCHHALDIGFDDIGLYYIVGLPQETGCDLEEIASTINVIFDMMVRRGNGNLIIGVNPFFPKPGTPLERSSYVGHHLAATKLEFIISRIKHKDSVMTNSRYVDETIISGRGRYDVYRNQTNKIILETTIGSSLSYYQPILSRGDRRVAPILAAVAENCDDIGVWKKVLSERQVDEKLFFSAMEDTLLPWNIIKKNVGEGFLKNEYRKAMKYCETRKCIGNCLACPIKCMR